MPHHEQNQLSGSDHVLCPQCDENFLMEPAGQEMYRMVYSVVHDHGFHLRGPLLVGCAQKYYTISFKDARKKLNYFNYS